MELLMVPMMHTQKDAPYPHSRKGGISPLTLLMHTVHFQSPQDGRLYTHFLLFVGLISPPAVSAFLPGPSGLAKMHRQLGGRSSL